MNGSFSSDLIQNPHLEGGPFMWEGGPTGVLLMHGLTASTAEVRPLAQSLNEHGYTVVGPVLPGHDAAPADVNAYTWRDWVRVMETAYRQLTARCEHVFVGGESTGGVLALYLASEHPEIAGILTYAPALRLTLSTLDVIKIYLTAPFIPYVRRPDRPPEDLSEADRLWKGYRVKSLRGAIELLRLQRRVRPRLSRIYQPILIAQGRLDRTVHPDVPAMICAGVNSAVKEVFWFERSRHCVMIDDEREQVADLTLRFVRQVLAGLQ